MIPADELSQHRGFGPVRQPVGRISAPDCSALAIAVLECEQELVSAKMSGLETGWEHPNTQAMWAKVAKIAIAIHTQNPSRQDKAARKEP